MMHVELQATCSALGYQEGKLYVKEPDCLETVKDLIRFLKREDETCDIRRQLGHAQIVENDIMPILVQYSKDEALWQTIIRLLVNLTQPAVLCFNGHVPEDKSLRNNYLEVVSHLQTMKEAFINDKVFAVITDKLGDLLKLDWEHRHEEHRLLIERLLILIRNILHIPTNPDAEQRTDDDAGIHDQILWAIHASGLEEILLYIASSEEERNLSLHILEIVSLMFKEQTTDMLAAAGVQRSMTEKQKDERELEMVREEEKLEQQANRIKFNSRHSRFGGTFVVKNFKSISDNDLIYHKSHRDFAKINLDNNKRPRKKPKNRKPIIDREVKRRSTLTVRLGLKEFCVQFIEDCYNPLMYAVKDILNREKSQELDETYYLWSMRFFMEFCRLHSRQVDLVSETMSVQAFHYIQVQLFQYYEMQQMEKKEAIAWGKRTHLALKAYQELLLTLDSMDKSGNTTLMESSRVIKSNIFYMMEFRDIFLTLLRHFDQNRQSRTYLKDLVETTHLFLKMLENFSKKTGHLVVQKTRKTIGGRKKKVKNQENRGHVEPSEQELEDLWDEISGDLSAIFQGRSDVPEDVAPFDAASEIDVDQQRADAMVRIQASMRERRPGEGVAIFRAAREVWPDRDEFGSADISPEDEFMALREIFMTNLPRPSTEIPGIPEEGTEEMEDEEEQVVTMVNSEQEFVFREFVVKFAKPEVLKAYVLLTADFQKNSTHTNHCCIKMLHRVAFDLGYVGMLFQLSLFRVFQKILLSPLAKVERYKEIGKFATFIVRRFVEVAENNKKVFMELLFWKTSKESIELVEGYGSYHSKGKVLWTEDAETEVRRLFDDYKENENEDKDTVDCIMERITDPSKSRGQIIRELKRQQLIESAKDLKKPKSANRAGPWREEDELELRELYSRFRDTDDPVGSILSDMCKRRSRPKVMEKLLSMGLVSDRRELYKKRGKSGARSRGRGNQSGDDSSDEGPRELPSDNEEQVFGHGSQDSSDVSSACSSDSDGDRVMDGVTSEAGVSGQTMADILKGLVEKGYKEQLAWIQRGLTRTADDREEDGDDVRVPIIPLTEENETAMEDEIFLSFLTKIGISAPANEQEAFWRIPAGLNPAELRNIASGLALDENDEPINADKITVKTVAARNKQKKEKKKRVTEPKQKKYSNKFAALKELVKKKAEAKITKRIRKKPDADETSSNDQGMKSPVRETITEDQSRKSSAKKKRRVKRIVDSDSDSDDDVPMASLRSENKSGVTGTQSDHESRTQSSQESGKQSGSQSGHESGSQSGPESGSQSGHESGSQSGHESGSQSGHESGSKSGSQSGRESGSQSGNESGHESGHESGSQSGHESGSKSVHESGSQSVHESGSKSGHKSGSQSGHESGSQSGNESGSQSGHESGSQSGHESGSQSGHKSGSQSGHESGSQSGHESPSPTKSGSGARQSKPSPQRNGRLKKMVSSDSDSDDDIPLKNLATRNQSESQGGSEKESQSQSRPLLFLSSSDESDLETGGRKKRVSTESQSNKRSRSADSDTEGSQIQDQKKPRLDDFRDSDTDRPLSSVIEETFPATLYTQGSESDDHVLLRKIIQKKNIIESDED